MQVYQIPPVAHNNDVAKLKPKIAQSQAIIRNSIKSFDAAIIPLTQAKNVKRPYQTLEEEKNLREEIVTAQIKAWRRMLPVY